MADDPLTKSVIQYDRLFRLLGLGAGGLVVLSILVLVGLDVVYAGRVLPGVQFLEINLGGQTTEQSQILISDRVGQTQFGVIKLEYSGQLWELDPNQFGFELDAVKLANEAMRVGRRGGVWQQLEERGYAILSARQPIIRATDLVHTFDQAKLITYLQEIATAIDQPQRNAHLIIKNSRATELVTSQDGLALDVDATVVLIAQNILSASAISLPVTVTKPSVTLADTNILGINTLIARGVSDFSGSPKNRRHNIGVGAGKFDGVIIAPGDTLSFLRVLGTVDSSTGYRPELVIKGDETTPEFGGGLCQVSTTAFRAILNGGLPVVERRNHSYRVAYYEPPGTDATIYQPYPDLKFTNDTPGSILMDTYIEGSKLYFDFYGTDTKREVQLDGPYVSNVTDYPEPIYIDTATLSVGETKQVEIAHRGADAVLYRRVYQNKKLIRNDTFKSHYIPWPAKYLRGAEDAAKVEADINNVLPGDTANENGDATIIQPPLT
ncbi:MAG: VanW family protein [candidate division Kazan bacterium GW2011_GWA1_50_15]|uniref:VanW family protein n=2 Tax=Bacteria division Kazan-3B-28 TaxID=1798534 RepID=A0A0G1ZH12_UNCK3|nr:MAG: VanW family protein [candidate division Kazan bacterium GW2011_GWA1_50_15]KKW25783.1 MAG: VanW family protein [candidate division Kazan bacterium GW2011_GWC1_52_13]KKW27202.1 MAG: VanW family protein [candidate division Kazan bacterium GW2011_GWB1_52_7]HCR42493.1 hypothetical protein [Patescibacteria group bacterium]